MVSFSGACFGCLIVLITTSHPKVFPKFQYVALWSVSSCLHLDNFEAQGLTHGPGHRSPLRSDCQTTLVGVTARVVQLAPPLLIASPAGGICNQKCCCPPLSDDAPLVERRASDASG